MRERESNGIRKNCIFFTLFYITKVAPSESVPLSKQKLETETHRPCIQENLQKYTRRLALTRTRLKNFYILSSEEEEEERERERGTFHSRARSFLSRREVEFPPLYISRVLKIGTLLACLPFLIKNPPRRTQVTQRRKNASTNTHIFKTRMAKYYPDIAKGAKGNRFQTRFLLYYFVPCFALFSVQTKARSLILLRRGSRRGVSPFFLSSFSSKKQIYSPALCPTKTNSPWTRNQSPAGYVFYILVSRFYQISRETRGFLCVRIIIGTRDRNIERFLLRCLSFRKSPDEEKRTKRTFSHARTLSLSFNL